MKPKVVVESFRNKPHKPLSKGGHPTPFSFTNWLIIVRRNNVSATAERSNDYGHYNSIIYRQSEDEKQT